MLALRVLTWHSERLQNFVTSITGVQLSLTELVNAGWLLVLPFGDSRDSGTCTAEKACLKL